MSISTTDVCNLALTHLGIARINDIDSDTDENAGLCKLALQPAINAELRAHSWTCAIARQSLAQEDYEVGDEYAYTYQLPTDPKCLRPLNLPDNADADYKIEGDQLLTNETTVVLRYIKEITDPGKLDSLLVQVVAVRLALSLAPKLSKKRVNKKDLEGEYRRLITNAQYANMIEAEECVGNDRVSWADTGR